MHFAAVYVFKPPLYEYTGCGRVGISHLEMEIGHRPAIAPGCAACSVLVTTAGRLHNAMRARGRMHDHELEGHINQRACPICTCDLKGSWDS